VGRGEGITIFHLLFAHSQAGNSGKGELGGLQDGEPIRYGAPART